MLSGTTDAVADSGTTDAVADSGTADAVADSEEALAGFPMLVRAIEYAGTDSVFVRLESLDGRTLPRAEAGAHIDIRLPDGVPLESSSRVRQYSLLLPLCTPTGYVVAVRRTAAGRGGSRWIHDGMRVGTTVRVTGPRNNFRIDENVTEHLLLAGGIGITPIYSMLARLTEIGHRARLHYYCRSAEHALFLDELSADPRVSVHHGSAAHPLAAAFDDIGTGADVYCCGPERMLRHAESCARDRGHRWHAERFAAAGGGIGAPAGDEFRVRLARQAIEVSVPPGESILEALLAAGADVEYSCEEGVCGACESRVVAGAPEHRDSVRSPAEHDELGTVMICCARGSETLVLDL
ncbi:PDR/VanB family oxidoreductase [Nocardia sp. BMG51109]|uniref:PDR/VanB family oxidoreductase n=1 Tax=Nocardia sp. BMG51109 TaxID=1056816 RepID=UPI0004BCF50A|nr:PDR/VanB family oxidoreductase [Nocardia sp. BMG51109]